MDAVKKLRGEKSKILFRIMGTVTCQLSTFPVVSEITERRNIKLGNVFVVVLHFLTKLTLKIVHREDRALRITASSSDQMGSHREHPGDPPWYLGSARYICLQIGSEAFSRF